MMHIFLFTRTKPHVAPPQPPLAGSTNTQINYERNRRDSKKYFSVMKRNSETVFVECHVFQFQLLKLNDHFRMGSDIAICLSNKQQTRECCGLNKSTFRLVLREYKIKVSKKLSSERIKFVEKRETRETRVFLLGILFYIISDLKIYL